MKYSKRGVGEAMLVLEIKQVERMDAPMESGSAGGVVLGQRRVPFKELRMGALLGAGGCGPDARRQDRWTSLLNVSMWTYPKPYFLLGAGACSPDARRQDMWWTSLHGSM